MKRPLIFRGQTDVPKDENTLVTGHISQMQEALLPDARIFVAVVGRDPQGSVAVSLYNGDGTTIVDAIASADAILRAAHQYAIGPAREVIDQALAALSRAMREKGYQEEEMPDADRKH